MLFPFLLAKVRYPSVNFMFCDVAILSDGVNTENMVARSSSLVHCDDVLGIGTVFTSGVSFGQVAMLAGWHHIKSQSNKRMKKPGFFVS